MTLDQGHQQDNRSGHNISSTSCQICEEYDAHYYWCHMDDTEKYFFKLMVGDFKQKMIIPVKFVKNFKGQISEVIKLEAPDGNKYDVQATRDLNKIVLGSGWAAFVNANRLKLGELLVFRYNGDSQFKVLIFDRSCCEKPLFRVIMNSTPDVQERDISHDQSFLGERRQRSRRHDNDNRKTRKMTPLDLPSPRSAEGVASENMNSGCLQETTEPRYVLATGCNLTTVQKAEVDALVKKIRPLIPLYIPAINKTSLSGSLVICKDYAAKHLPHEDTFITLSHPQKSTIWIDNLKVLTDGACMLSAGWLCFVLHNELQESDVCAFELSKSNGEVTMVVHTSKGGHQLAEKEPESKNKCSYPVEGEETEGEESYNENAESDYYYSSFAKHLTSKEKNELLRSASIQLGNPVYVAILRESHLRRNNNIMSIPTKLGAKHLAKRSHDILLLRPNRKEEWCVRYYYRKNPPPAFMSKHWTKFIHENRLRVDDVCVFELLKGMTEVTMMVHVFRKVDDRFVLLG